MPGSGPDTSLENARELVAPSVPDALPDVPGGEINLIPASALVQPLKVTFPLWQNSMPSVRFPESVRMFLDDDEVAAKQWTVHPIQPDDLFVNIPIDKLVNRQGSLLLHYDALNWSGDPDNPTPSYPVTITIDTRPPILAGTSKLQFSAEILPPLSQYDADKQVIALSSGETFKVTGSSSTDPTRLVMAEQKIQSFHFHQETPNRYRIVHKSGVVEILGREGDLFLPQRIYSAEGHEVSLEYLPFDNGISRLHTVTDAQGSTLLEINLPPSAVEILLRPDGTPGGALARFVMKLRNSGPGDEVYEVVLPTADASWRFTYQKVNGLLCITEVKTPVGGHETIQYAGIGHGFPGNARAPLPRVWRHQIHPGFQQPPLEVRYDYHNSNLPGNSNNFLGNNATIDWDDQGLDNLYKAAGRYQYGTTETHYADGAPVRGIERTFNRFHLISEEKTTQGKNIHQVFTTYYADDKPDQPFSDQDPQCQLPRRVENRWSLEGGTSRSESELSAYDTHGNLTEQTQANGVKEHYSYFPAAGIPDECPPDPHGFVRHLREKTVTPASDREKGAPVLRTRNRYALMPPVQGTAEASWLVLSDETLYQVEGTQEHEVQRSAYLTFNQPLDPLRHGRRQQQAITLKGLTTKTDYAYETPTSAFAGETVLQTTETLTGFDHGVAGKHTQEVVILEHSLLHGEPLLTRDDNNVEIRYTYDALLRVTNETVAPGTDCVASRTYRYFLTNGDGQQASQEAIDVKGVETRTLFDGLNRAIQEQRQDPDHRTGALAQAFRNTYCATYDALGQLAEETELDWRSADEEDDLQLVSQYRYDDWGEQRSVVRPDGVEEHEAGDGGLNAYMYVMGNPIKYTDTTGHMFGQAKGLRRLSVGDDVVRVGRPGVVNQTDDLLAGFTMSGGDQTVKFTRAAPSANPIGHPGGVGPSASVPSTPAPYAGPSPRRVTFAQPQPPAAGPVPKQVVAPQTAPIKASPLKKTPKQPTKDEFKKWGHARQYEFLSNGGVDPTQTGLHGAVKRKAIDVRKPKDRFKDDPQ